jgi:hypothetical protein
MGWKKRLKKELKQLRERHQRLEAFLNSNDSQALPITLHSLLMRQAEVMTDYMGILGERISYLKDD